MIKQYGISEMKSINSEEEKHTENVFLRGFTIVPNILNEHELQSINPLIEKIYIQQKKEFDHSLDDINEADVVRAPIAYHEIFAKIIENEFILSLLKKLLGNAFILHLQNAIINRPSKEHYQTSWHRDIPYQEYTVSKPISVNVFYCLSPFNETTGATKILPYSHLREHFPSIEFTEENGVTVHANAGDVVIFDSWLYHRASVNISNIVRYGLNHVYTVPIFKQQIDLPRFLNGKYSDHPVLKDILGYTFQIPSNVSEYRKNRLNKINKK